MFKNHHLTSFDLPCHFFFCLSDSPTIQSGAALLALVLEKDQNTEQSHSSSAINVQHEQEINPIFFNYWYLGMVSYYSIMSPILMCPCSLKEITNPQLTLLPLFTHPYGVLSTSVLSVIFLF